MSIQHIVKILQILIQYMDYLAKNRAAQLHGMYVRLAGLEPARFVGRGF